MKFYKIKIEPEAKEELFEASNWYEKQQLGLGKEFKKQFTNIIHRPRIYEIRYRN